MLDRGRFVRKTCLQKTPDQVYPVAHIHQAHQCSVLILRIETSTLPRTHMRVGMGWDAMQGEGNRGYGTSTEVKVGQFGAREKGRGSGLGFVHNRLSDVSTF